MRVELELFCGRDPEHSLRRGEPASEMLSEQRESKDLLNKDLLNKDAWFGGSV